MKFTITHALLLTIAVLLGVIIFLLARSNRQPVEQITNENSTLETEKIEEIVLPISRTRTSNFSFVSWSDSTDKISKDPLQFRLYNKGASDPLTETIIFVKDLKAYKSNPETDSKYVLVSPEASFTRNTYRVYQHIESKKRVFVIKNKIGGAILISLSDPEALVPHYIDLSSITFEDLTSSE